MKALWNIASVIAVANIIALAGFAGWLMQSGRLDAERLTEVRKLLQETIAEQDAREKAEQAEAKAAADAAAAAQEPTGPARSASELVAMRLQANDIDLMRIERLRREIEDLQRKLARDQQMLDEKSEEFKAEKDAFEAMRERLREIEGQAQFRKSVLVLETVKSTDAKDMLAELLQSGAQEQVVSYLNAMDERARTRVIAEFVKGGQPDLAAQLLESLRLRGLDAIASGDSPDDQGR